MRLAKGICVPTRGVRAAASVRRYNHTDHDLEKIVVGNEPAVSGGLGSQANTHNGAAPCSPGASRGNGGLPAPSSQLRCARHSGSVPPMNMQDHQLCIGARTSGVSVMLDAEERRRHLYIIGQTGTGKSTLMLNLIQQDLVAGEGLALLDPHGDLAEAVLAHVPKVRTNDLVYINPADVERPVGFNPLSHVTDDLKPIVADGVVSAFRHVWPESWGPRLDYILTNAVRALLDVPGATLLMLPRLLIDDVYRAQIEHHIRDPVVRGFWLHEYAGYSTSFRAEAIAPIQNKIGKALMEPRLRNMLAQPTSTITPRRLMDEGAIVICNLSKGRLGAHLLGALLTTAFAQAALSRADTPAEDRQIFHFYADEFQSFATESFALILSEARKYALTLCTGHQYLAQLSDQLRAAVFGNVGSIIACRPGAEDAAILAKQIGLASSEALLDLPNFSGWARLLQNGTPTSPIRLDLYDAPRARRGSAHRLINTSRLRFGRPRAEIERRIREFLDVQ
jgi:Helicase HerA, central domain